MRFDVLELHCTDETQKVETARMSCLQCSTGCHLIQRLPLPITRKRELLGGSMRFDVLEPPRTYVKKLYTPCVLRGFDEVRCA